MAKALASEKDRFQHVLSTYYCFSFQGGIRRVICLIRSKDFPSNHHCRSAGVPSIHWNNMSMCFEAKNWSLLHNSRPTKSPETWWENVRSTLHESIYLCTPCVIEGRTCMHYEACCTEYSWDCTHHMTQGVTGLSIHHIINSACFPCDSYDMTLTL